MFHRLRHAGLAPGRSAWEGLPHSNTHPLPHPEDMDPQTGGRRWLKAPFSGSLFVSFLGEGIWEMYVGPCPTAERKKTTKPPNLLQAAEIARKPVLSNS